MGCSSEQGAPGISAKEACPLAVGFAGMTVLLRVASSEQSVRGTAGYIVEHIAEQRAEQTAGLKAERKAEHMAEHTSAQKAEQQST